MIKTEFFLFVFVVIWSASFADLFMNLPPPPPPATTSPPPPAPATTSPPQPKILEGWQCEVNVSSDAINGVPRGKRICVQPKTSELLKALQKIGGYNPLYTAINETQAKNFPDPRWFLPEPTTTVAPVTTLPPYTKPLYTKPRYRKPYYKKPRYRRPRYKRPRHRKPWYNKPQHRKPWHRKPRYRRHWYKKPRYRRPWQRPHRWQEKLTGNIHDAKSGEKSLHKETIVLSKRGSETKNCWTSSQKVGSSSNPRFHLCGECHVITTLDDKVIPRLINEAVCKHGLESSDPKKDKSKVCAFSSGLCKQRVIHFPALKNTGKFEESAALTEEHKKGTIYVPKWEEFTQIVKAGCQCQMFESSFQILRIRNN